MFNDKLSDYVEGAAAKYLSRVDANAAVSNQHEIGGLPSIGFKQWLGTPNKDAVYRYRVRQIYISDEIDAPATCDSSVTWYDCRRKDPRRSAEYRLYYYDSPVIASIREGDFFLIAKLHRGVTPFEEIPLPQDGAELKEGSLLMVFAPAGSTVERQLRALFGLEHIGEAFAAGRLNAASVLLPLRLMLEDLGIELNQPIPEADRWTDTLLRTFGGHDFPKTAAFSAFARNSVADTVNALHDPDGTLMTWMEQEEMLFRLYEKHLVQVRLRQGFGKHGDDVDEFISYSLGVQNRRKSRVGHAFEGHIAHLFNLHQVPYEQGRGKGQTTENNAKPDFLFPSFAKYHDAHYPATSLMMLGAKTTCKDRWRQVLSEAKRIEQKHLITLEAAISEAQTQEMAAHQLQLVVPQAIQSSYTAAQQKSLWNVEAFIAAAKAL